MRDLTSTLTLSIFAGLALILLAGPAAALEDTFVPGEVIVKFRDGGRSLSSVERDFPGVESVHSTTSKRGEVVLKAGSKRDLNRVIERLERDPQVESFSFNVKKYFSLTPDDPLYLNGFPQGLTYQNQYYHQLIRSAQAWEFSTGSEDVVVAVIDSGVNIDHPDLQKNIWTNQAEANGESGVDDDNNGFVDDVHGADTTCNNENAVEGCEEGDPSDKLINDSNAHGMATTGLIGASTNNGTGMAGLAGGNGNTPGVQIMPIRAGTNNISVMDEVEAIDYAVDNGADIISMSFGGQSDSAEPPAINRAWEAGVLMVAAAGNNQGGPVYDWPARFNRVMGIGGTELDTSGSEPEEVFGSFSNWNPDSDDQSMVAPGANMITLGVDNSYRRPGNEGEPNLAPITGTSFAAPLVAGAAGLALSVNPDLSHVQLKNLLESSADDMGDPGYDRKFGHGRLNVQRAVEEAQGGFLDSDLNGDGVVNEDDLDELERKFGARRGDSDYNRSIDLNGDGVIDELDALIIADHYGDTQD